MKKIFISGPYSLGDVAVNVKNAMDVANKLISYGFAPFCPHLTHFLHLNRPQTYNTWLEIDLAFLEICEGVLRIPGESSGADKEVIRAKELGIPVFLDVESLINYFNLNQDLLEEQAELPSLLVNMIECGVCGDRVVSRYRHDYVQCGCGKSFTDGGNDYQRYGGAAVSKALYSNSPWEEIRKYYCRGSRGKNGNEKLKWIPLCEMTDEHLNACIEYNKKKGLGDSHSTKMCEDELYYRFENEITIKEEI